MSELLTSSLFWRLFAALAAWLSRSPLGRFARLLGRLWRESATYGFFARLLCAAPKADGSLFRRLLDGCNAGVHRIGSRFVAVLRESFAYRIYASVLRALRESFLLGWLFAGGVTTLLLLLIAAVAPLDYIIRATGAETFAAIWDELLLVVCLLWIVYQRMSSKQPLRSRANAVDVWLAGYMLAGLVLLLYTSSVVSVNITGYRASMQYILMFFLVTRLIRDDRDLLIMYRLMVFLAFVFALHGIWQYIIGVEIPWNWTDQAETAVRTRVFSIFKNPNIMGGYMVLFAPMAIGMAYASDSPAEKVFYWICGLCMCLGCLFTMSRGAWLALAVAAVVFALIVDRRLFALLLVGGIAASFLPFVRSRIGYLFTDAFAESNARAGRGKRWQTAFHYLDEYNAWDTGLGYGMFGGAVAMQNPINPNFEYMYVDNYYVKTLAENGIVGLTALLSSMAGLLWGGIRSCARNCGTKQKPLCVGMLAGLVGVLVHSFFESLWEEPYMMALFFTVAAMLIYFGFFSCEPEKG